jgi:hypothetical protein
MKHKMFKIQNPVQHISPAAQGGWGRILLVCRYDFKSKTWNLPDPQFSLHDRSGFSNNQAVLLPLLNFVMAEFSDSSLGGDCFSNCAASNFQTKGDAKRAVKPLRRLRGHTRSHFEA